MNLCTARKTVTALTAAALGACASAPETSLRQITRAETTIENAEETGARQHSPDVLSSARRHLANAREAAEAGDSEKAVRLATRAELDAELAVARAERSEAEAALAELDQSLRTLQQELTRDGS